jgi:predicted RNA-binding protein YlqC (UPF0109 family)
MTATEFLRFIIASIVAHPDAIEITEKHDELGILLSLKVDPTDMGSLIGRSGKTIDSVRTVIRVFGSKLGERINLRIIEENRVENSPS